MEVVGKILFRWLGNVNEVDKKDSIVLIENIGLNWLGVCD